MTVQSSITQRDKAIALSHAQKALERRIALSETISKNSFAARGNNTAIARLRDTMRDMQSGSASEKQYRYWKTH